MAEYVTKALSVKTLEDLGDSIPDKWFKFAIMNGVSSDYEALIATMAQQSGTDISVDQVTSLLLNESERRRGKRESTPRDDSTLLTKHQGRKPWKPMKKKLQWFNCAL